MKGMAISLYLKHLEGGFVVSMKIVRHSKCYPVNPVAWLNVEQPLPHLNEASGVTHLDQENRELSQHFSIFLVRAIPFTYALVPGSAASSQ